MIASRSTARRSQTPSPEQLEQAGYIYIVEEKPVCPVCGSEEYQKTCSYTSHLKGTIVQRYKCKRCGSSWGAGSHNQHYVHISGVIEQINDWVKRGYSIPAVVKLLQAEYGEVFTEKRILGWMKRLGDPRRRGEHAKIFICDLPECFNLFHRKSAYGVILPLTSISQSKPKQSGRRRVEYRFCCLQHQITFLASQRQSEPNHYLEQVNLSTIGLHPKDPEGLFLRCPGCDLPFATEHGLKQHLASSVCGQTLNIEQSRRHSRHSRHNVNDTKLPPEQSASKNKEIRTGVATDEAAPTEDPVTASSGIRAMRSGPRPERDNIDGSGLPVSTSLFRVEKDPSQESKGKKLIDGAASSQGSAPLDEVKPEKVSLGHSHIPKIKEQLAAAAGRREAL